MFVQCLVLAVLTIEVKESSNVSVVVSYGLNNFRTEHFKPRNSKGILQTVTDGLFVADKLAVCIYNVVCASTSLLYTHASYSAIHKVKFNIFTKRGPHNAINVSLRLCVPNSKLPCTLLRPVHTQHAAPMPFPRHAVPLRV